MPSTTHYRRGEVVLVPFPFTDLTTTKQRPALVLTSDQHNATREDVVLLAITSQVPAQLAEDEFSVPPGDLRSCGLPKASIVRLTKIVTLHRDLVIKRIGAMPAASLEQLLSSFRRQY